MKAEELIEAAGENRPEPYADSVRPIDWRAAFQAGLIVGGIFLIFTRGFPWASSDLISPRIMERYLKSPDILDDGLNPWIGCLHLLVAVNLLVAMIYTMILMPMVHRLRPATAIITAGLIGVGGYFAGHYLFLHFVDSVSGQSELVAVVTHIGFTTATAGLYKGFVQRQI